MDYVHVNKIFTCWNIINLFKKWNEFQRKGNKSIQKLEYIFSSENCLTFIYLIMQLLSYITPTLLWYLLADKLVIDLFKNWNKFESWENLKPCRQVCIVPIYLTSIYECCQLIHLKLKKINKEKKRLIFPFHSFKLFSTNLNISSSKENLILQKLLKA